jgi:hypothetical protein
LSKTQPDQVLIETSSISGWMHDRYLSRCYFAAVETLYSRYKLEGYIFSARIKKLFFLQEIFKIMRQSNCLYLLYLAEPGIRGF